jgi:hypothetical protein
MSNTESTPEPNQIQALMAVTIPNMTRYMSFLGVLAIIGGILYCITIVGAIIGIPIIFVGVRMRESAEAYRRYLTSNSNQDLYTALERQTRAFFIHYVLAIIGLVILGIYLIVMIGLLASGALY